MSGASNLYVNQRFPQAARTPISVPSPYLPSLDKVILGEYGASPRDELDLTRGDIYHVPARSKFVFHRQYEARSSKSFTTPGN